MRKSSIILAVILSLATIYFGYQIVYIFPLILTTQGLILNSILIVSEILCALFSVYLYHSVFCAMEWKHFNYKSLREHPAVTIQVPTYNESKDVWKGTLEACMKQDYPKDKYEIIVADDSSDANMADEIRKFCSQQKIKFIHRDHRRGFKAGALNNILGMSKGDVVAIIDADDVPERTFLSHSVEALYSENKIAFVQSRNAERNDGFNAVTGIGRLVRDLFFGAIMKSKDMRNLAIFCGSGGVIKKSVLLEHGGWPEETVTEDIDLSTKIFASGYTSRFINPVECRGLLPSTFTGLCGQTARWAHGTTNTLRLRWKMIARIPGFFRKLEHFLSCMTYLIGPAIVAIDLAMVYHLLTRTPIFHMYEPTSMWIFGVGFTVSSFLALLYVQILDKKFSLSRTLLYIFTIYGLSINFTKASLKALLHIKFEFFRTPRNEARKSLGCVMKRYWIESVLGVLSIGSSLTAITSPSYAMQAIWVFLFGIGFLTAPALAIKYR